MLLYVVTFHCNSNFSFMIIFMVNHLDINHSKFPFDKTIEKPVSQSKKLHVGNIWKKSIYMNIVFAAFIL